MQAQVSPADLLTATPPTACALILGLPLTCAAFEADLATGDGAPLAAIAMDLAARATASGVLVCCASSLECIAALARARPVVTFIAHWRAWSLRGSDFRAEPACLVESIQAGLDPVRTALARRLAPEELARIATLGSAAARAGQMAEHLNRTIIDSDDPLPGVIVPEHELVYRPWLRMRHRQLLDDAFPDLLAPGNRVELRDGLHAANDVADQFPTDWSGIVDLALCRSASVAKLIKAGRSDRRVIFTQNEVVPEIRIRMLRELYRRLESGDRNYAAELAWMFRNMRDLTDGVRDAISAGLWRHHAE